ncbi:MAG: Asp-tRNA(Asn)/Glu-tRNA(Gln) amidotransferase subunit GatC [Planctomycetaceae bacterium]|nr:Asp-tRNA(Asn)/Glu-tRNA(Gln) amidotransferase subunit GatC [Planctomycetaceae bacterium]
MALPLDTVKKVAGLARLQLTGAEIEMFSQQLGGILDYVAMLDELDTSAVEPMVHAIELTNVLRDDVLVPSLPRVDALQNAPKQDGRYFLVPAILEG